LRLRLGFQHRKSVNFLDIAPFDHSKECKGRSRLQLALVHAIAAHDLAAHAFHRAVHRLVDL
jgi:hypothetical protein